MAEVWVLVWHYVALLKLMLSQSHYSTTIEKGHTIRTASDIKARVAWLFHQHNREIESDIYRWNYKEFRDSE